MMGHKCATCTTAIVLVLIGALNWGLVGLGMFMNKDWNVVHMILGQWMMVEAVVYVLVGLAALYKIFLMGKCCGDKSGMSMGK
jgi:uncharacterized membrane protein YuzA (DUF378 family)